MTPKRKGAFLTRLARDTAGNTLAIMAAAFFPLAGLIGGGVDMTRVYITKTRLQQACDAGALSGRKTMGAGAWTTSGSSSSREQAYQLFAANFKDGDFGTSGLSRDFTESDGTVTGTASAEVPMTLMRLFGEDARTVSVTCTAKMEIPNTDVMFVLDVTFSMQTDNKIGGLHSATKCFYEALLKVNTSEVCGGDPTATSYNGTAQIRLGFVPYAVNVNVGKLLPNADISDTWEYPTRRPNFTTVHAWTVGTQSSTTYGAWSPASTPSSYNTAGGFSGFTRISASPGSVTVGGTTYPRQKTSATSSNCASNNNLMANSSGTLAARADVGQASPSEALTGSPAPVYPAATQALTYTRTDTRTVTAYRYRWFNPSGSDGNGCWLESATATYDRTQSGTASKPVTWTDYQNWDGTWDYSQQTLNVSALKTGGSTWAAGPVALTHTETGEFTGTQAGPTVKLSGSNSNTALTVPGNLSVTWVGCILERPTWRNSDGTPGDEWNPIPDEALDMDINHVPSAATPEQGWGPMLQQAMWGREDSSGNSTLNARLNVTGSGYPAGTGSSGFFPYHQCPAPARKLTEYNTLGDFETYINSLAATGYGTYHDIGLLWGARLLSPTGIFAGENAFTENGGAIERHLIFMTDGDAQTVDTNIDSHGWHYWDRNQTTYAPSNAQLDALVEARLPALCTAIKNMNIKLWVISYGGGVNAANEARLEACASPGQYFEAADGAALIARFKQIASEIADLRLTE